MTNSRQAAKRVRQAHTHRLRNQSLKTRMRTNIKKVRSIVDNQDKNSSQEAFRKVQSTLDNMVNKGIITKNKASRLKSRLNKATKKIAQPTS